MPSTSWAWPSTPHRTCTVPISPPGSTRWRRTTATFWSRSNASRLGHEALAICGELGDRHGEAVEVLALGNVATFRGDAAEAQRRYRQTAELATASGDDEMRGRALSNLGVVARFSGDVDEATRCLREARRIMQDRGDDHSVVLADLNLSGVLLDRGEPAEAERLTQEAVRRSQDVGDEFMLLEALENLSAAWAEQGRLAAAGWLYGAADAMAGSLSLVRNRLEQPLFERYVERARDRAASGGHDALFTAAWTAGATATRHAVIAVALGEQPTPGEDAR